MENINWLEIVKEALQEAIARSGTAVAGAKLRIAVAQAAHARSLSFPPPEMGKFSAFIESFPADFILHRRPGQDILVVPADRPELLAVESPSGATISARVREDLFKALTALPTSSMGRAHYLPESDSVVWVKAGESIPAAAVEIPATTLESEIELRRRFIVEMQSLPQAQAALQKALTESAPLRAFSIPVHEYGLVKAWHQFRLSALSTLLREWSVNKAIPWQKSWVDLGESRTASAVTIVMQPGVDNKRRLFELSTLLTDEDLTRISIPLDVVLRLLSQK